MANYAADLTSFTAAQRKAFQNAAALSPQHSSVLGYTDNPDGTTTNYLGGGETETGRLSPDGQGAYNFNAISSSALAPVPSITPVQPQQTPIYPVAGLGPPPAEPMGAEENKAQGVSERLQQINDSLVGESAYRAEQEQAQGIPTLNKSVQDLTSRLTALKNEALAIPLQLQQDAEGRGITKGGLAPIEAGALRKNAIQALSVNSLLEASRGNLTTALDMVDRAVAQRFDPLKEEQRAKIANLDLIMRSPAYTKEEKDRAARQKRVEEDRARQLALDEQADKEKQKIAVDAASLGADPMTLKRIQEAPDAATAQFIATQAGFVPQEKLSTQVIELGGRKVLIDTQTGNTIKDLGAADVGGAAGAGEIGALDPTQKTIETLNFLRNTAAEAMELADASGASGLSRAFGDWFIGDTKFRQLEGQTNSLRTNVLALMTDPDVKKFFGPQMSNADVQLMTAAGTSLNPEKNSPAQMKTEIRRLDDLFQRMLKAVKEGQGVSTDNVIIAPTGEEVIIID